MSTILRFVKERQFIRARNQEGTIDLRIGYLHPIASLFPEGQESLVASCRVRDGKVEVKKLLRASAWKGEGK